MIDNVMYFRTLNSIGGVEQYYYYISKLFDNDIVIYISNGDAKQIARLRKRIPVKLWHGEHIECKKLFLNFNLEILPSVDAEEVYFTAHGNYEDMIERGQATKEEIMTIANNEKITHFIGVSKAVCESWERVTGKKMTLCYNPISLDEPKKILKLILAQRLTKEKGKERILKLYKALESYGEMFQMDIYSNDSFDLGKYATFHEPNLDINRYFGEYDYYISLTDEEGYGYSVVESLLRGTPIVATPCKVFKEIGLDETNTIFLDFDCSNLNEVVEKMFNSHLKFKFEPPRCDLDKFLVKGVRDYDGERMVKVKCIMNFFDLEARIGRILDEEWMVSEDRYEYLHDKGLVELEEEDGAREEEVKRTTKKATRKAK